MPIEWYTAKIYKYRIGLNSYVNVVNGWNTGIFYYVNVHAKFAWVPQDIYRNIVC